MDRELIDGFSYFAIALLIAGFIVAKPGPALIVLGLLSIVGGLFTVTAGALGIPIAASGVIAGLSLIGFGRLIMFVESIRDETRLLRKDIAILRSSPVEVLDPLEAEMRREVQSVPKERRLFARR